MVKSINTSGKRKTAIARATLQPGKGIIRVNSVPLESYGNELVRMKISEPIVLTPNMLDGVDVSIDVQGGGVMGQAEGIEEATRPWCAEEIPEIIPMRITMIPVRCFTCGKVVSSAYEEFKHRSEAGEDPKKILDDLGMTRYCCRRMLLTHKEIIDDLNPYQ
jgi:DNA-directed RNA polymerase subunit N